MRLQSIELVSFGAYSGREVSGLEPGLNVVLGSNEAGKSTLLGALRFGLFGSEHKGYDPLDGGKRQVALQIERNGARWLLTRRQVAGKGAFSLKMAQGPGVVYAEEFARDWLGGVPLTKYRSVYALGLDELQSDTQVRDLLLDAEFGNWGKRLRDAIRETGEQAGEVFLPRGKRSLNVALADREAACREVARFSLRPDELEAKESSVAELERKARGLADEIQGLMSRRSELRDLREARFQWESLCTLETQIADREYVSRFSPTAAAAYRRADEERSASLGKAREAADACKRLLAELQQIPADPTVLAAAEVIDTLALEAERLYALPGQLREAGSQARQARTEAREHARQTCGPQADVEALSALNASVPARSELQELGKALEQARQAAAAFREREREAAEAEQAAAEAECKARAALEGLPAPINQDRLCQRRDLAEQWAGKKLQEQHALQNLRGAQERLGDLRRQREREEKARQDAQNPPQAAEAPEARRGGGKVVLLGAGVVLLAAGAVLLALGQGVAGASLLAGGILMMVVGATQAGSAPAAAVRVIPPPLTITDAEITAAQRQVEAARQAHEALQAKTRACAEALGLGSDASEEQVAASRGATEKMLAQAATAAIGRAEAEVALSKAEETLAAARIAAGKRVADVRKAQEAVQMRERAWRERLRDAGLPEGLSPATAVLYLEGALAVQQKLGEAAKHQQEADRIRADLAGFRGRVERQAEVLSDAVPAEDEWGIGRARAWAARLKEAREQDALRKEKQAALKGARETEGKESTAAHEAAGRMADALQKAGARDEDDLLKREDAHKRLQDLSFERDKMHAALKGARSEEQWAEFERALCEADWLGIEAEWSEVDTALIQKKDEHDGIQRQIGKLNGEMDALWCEEDLADAQARREQAAARVREHGRAWAAQTAAHALLSLTRTLFEREQQPESIRRTGELFAELTDRQWRNVLSLDDSVVVEGGNGEGTVEREPTKLSRGAREALFLCARFAAIERAVDRCPLPVALDDVLVNLDPDRSRRALDLIARLAEKTQVLLLTCHPHVLEGIQASGHAHHLVEI